MRHASTILQHHTTMNTPGRIHLYTGDGKGKTTASVGLCVRAAGAGLKVLFVQFMKGRATSEILSLEKIGVQVFRATKNTKFVSHMTEPERAACAGAQMANLEYAKSVATLYDLLVLDEITHAITLGMVPLEAVLAFLESRPTGLEVVLTGRDAPEVLCSVADYVSHIQAVKHPYAAGTPARKGIEF